MYSYQTSLPAYKENQSEKLIQADKIYSLIKSNGQITLLQLSEATHLPQSTVSGRVNDLMKDKRVEYSGMIIYKNRYRKRLVPVL